jgi:hypothetical protein
VHANQFTFMVCLALLLFFEHRAYRPLALVIYSEYLSVQITLRFSLLVADYCGSPCGTRNRPQSEMGSPSLGL